MRNEQSSEAIQQTQTTETASDIGQTAKKRSETARDNEVVILLTNPRARSACFCALANPMPSSIVTNVITVVFIVVFNVEVRLV